MRLKNFINERTSIYGSGITFFDIDQTILNTTARTLIKKDGKVIKKLTNYEFLRYTPEEGETADFSEYSDARYFRQTAKPIQPIINRIKRMFSNIDNRGSKVVILTARETPDNKEEFLNAFKDVGLPIDRIQIVHTGKSGESGNNIPQKKKNAIFSFLKSGEYRRARLVDDSKSNCRAFLELCDELPQDLINKMRIKYKIPEDEPVIDFYGLWVKKDGSIQRIQ